MYKTLFGWAQPSVINPIALRSYEVAFNHVLGGRRLARYYEEDMFRHVETVHARASDAIECIRGNLVPVLDDKTGLVGCRPPLIAVGSSRAALLESELRRYPLYEQRPMAFVCPEALRRGAKPAELHPDLKSRLEMVCSAGLDDDIEDVNRVCNAMDAVIRELGRLINVQGGHAYIKWEENYPICDVDDLTPGEQSAYKQSRERVGLVGRYSPSHDDAEPSIESLQLKEMASAA
jgi:hypothetical protein